MLGEDIRSSLLTEAVGAGERRKYTGIVPLRLAYSVPGAPRHPMDLVLKVKPLDSEVIIEVGKIASLVGGDVAEQYSQWRQSTGFKDTHTRELAVYRNANKPMLQVMPELYGLVEDPSREVYALLMERLGADMILTGSTRPSEDWKPHHVHAAIEGIASVHAAWLGREAELISAGWLGDIQTAHRAGLMRPLWKALVEHNSEEYPTWISARDARRLIEIIDGIPDWWPKIEQAPRTLVHGDFNPRNIGLRAMDLSLVAYDWELATLHLPQRDLVELLSFVLTPEATADAVFDLIERHRRAVGHDDSNAESWFEQYRLALWDFTTTRLQLYIMADTHQALQFLDNVVRTAMHLLTLAAEA
ncbi:phosphotransferase [Rhodococcus pyridinivorans]|uniref:phosphotransferase n=1 Tax=Rhodococcus pyridinivorans TaxID=103816 RepID=UPI0037CB300D